LTNSSTESSREHYLCSTTTLLIVGMIKARIFISHSAKDDASRQLRDCLYLALESGGYVPLLDQQQLESGDDWRRKLRTWLGLCHAAVVLISPNVIESTQAKPIGSPWVYNEAAILVWRRELDEEFVVVPVILPGVDVSKLNQGPFEPLNLLAIQGVTVAPGEKPEAVIPRILARLEERKEQLANKTPMQELEQFMAQSLEPLKSQALETVATQLQIELGPWRSDDNQATAFVRALFHRESDVIAKAIQRLSAYPAVSRQALRQMRDILTAFWIDPQAVAPVAHVVKLPLKQRAVSLGAEHMIIASMYIQRACCLYPGWDAPWVNNVAATRQAKRLIAEITKSIRERLKLYENGVPFSDDMVKRYVNKAYQQKPLFVIVPGAVDAEVLTAVRNDFPTVTFFLVLGHKPIGLQQLAQNYVAHLLPDLDAEKEDDIWIAYTSTKQYVE
jgi:TIR domain-containing protein